MKIFRTLLTLLLVVSSCVMQGMQLSEDADFEQIPASSNIIIEQTKRATQGIDWVFELDNQSFNWLFIQLENGTNNLILSSDDQPDQTDQVAGDYFLLKNGQVVRVAGIDRTQPLQVTILLKNEIEALFDKSKRFGRSVESFFAHAKRHGRVLTLTLDGDQTAFLSIDDRLQVKPVSKSFLKRKTDSGLPLNNNITHF